MTRMKDRHLVLGVLLLAVITACVNLPESSPEVAPAPQSGESMPVAGAATLPPEPATPDTAVAPAVGSSVATFVPVQPQASVSTPVPGANADSIQSNLPEQVEVLCDQIGNKLGSVSVEDCLQQSFRFGGGFSINQRPLIIKELPPVSDRDDHFRVLLLGGIHGDEYSSISIIFKWLELFSHNAQEGDFHWRIAPLANPDGLLDGSKAQRQNANGVDLNRNFPSGDWTDKAAQYWQANTGSNPRRFPGEAPASEPEVQWIVDQIEEFNPDVIISVHAPYHLLDFDGPAEAPQRIGELYLHQLGVYPGSLGNYAGLDMQIPVVTLELPSAGILPNEEQIRVMWRDLVTWLDTTGRKNLASGY
jgi:protein MpaA